MTAPSPEERARKLVRSWLVRGQADDWQAKLTDAVAQALRAERQAALEEAAQLIGDWGQEYLALQLRSLAREGGSRG